MPVDQQKRVFEPCDPAVRRVIVSTNIAATSVTVDGVVYVVDSGYVKQSSHNQQTGLDSLQVVPIATVGSEAAGREGRTHCPRQCYRLYSAAFFSAQAEDTVPEIQRVSLTSVMLSLKSMGISNVVEFAYLDPPEERMILEAVKQLYYFQCIDQSGRSPPSVGRWWSIPFSRPLHESSFAHKSWTASMWRLQLWQCCLWRVFLCGQQGRNKASLPMKHTRRSWLQLGEVVTLLPSLLSTRCV